MRNLFLSLVLLFSVGVRAQVGGDSVIHAPGGGTGGGLDEAGADALYCRLDGTNGPMTGTWTTQVILPDGDNTRDLGSEAAAWQDGFFDTSVVVAGWTLTSGGLDQSSAATVTFNVGNSGAGVADVSVDGQVHALGGDAAATPNFQVEAGEGIYDSGTNSIGISASGNPVATFEDNAIAFGTFGTQLLGATTTCAAPSYSYGGATSYGLNVTGAGATQLCVAGVAILGAAGTGLTILDSAGNTEIAITTASGAAQSLICGNEAGGGCFSSRGGSAIVGSKANEGVTSVAFRVGESITISSATDLFYVTGSGKYMSALASTVTCASTGVDVTVATQTHDPQTNVVYVVNNDDDGCEITLLDTSGVVHSEITYVVQVNAGGVVTFEDSAGVVEATTACDTTGITVSQRADCVFSDETNDLYRCSCGG